MFVFSSDSKIVSRFPFTCNWQKRFWDSESVIAHFPSNKGGTLDIQILHSSMELHLAHVCMLFAM